MFQSIKYLRYNKEKNQYIYQIVDSDFTCEADAHQRGDAVPWDAAVALIQEYSRRSLNVSKNLALCYLFCQKEWGYNSLELINVHKDYIDKYYSELGFSKKYYHCTLNQFKQLTYGKNQ